MKERFSCGQCSKNFSTKHQLLEHVKILHEQKLLTCEYCGMQFKSRTPFRRHIKGYLINGSRKPPGCKAIRANLGLCDPLNITNNTLNNANVNFVANNVVTESSSMSINIGSNSSFENEINSHNENEPNDAQDSATPALSPIIITSSLKNHANTASYISKTGICGLRFYDVANTLNKFLEIHAQSSGGF